MCQHVKQRLNRRNNKRTHTIEENLRNISRCAKMRKSYEMRLKNGLVFVCTCIHIYSLVSIEIYIRDMLSPRDYLTSIYQFHRRKATGLFFYLNTWIEKINHKQNRFQPIITVYIVRRKIKGVQTSVGHHLH